jgi:acetylornithine deacetylase
MEVPEVEAVKLIDRNELVALLEDLVRIPSVNPAFQPGGDERQLGLYIRSFFERLGLPSETQEVFPGRDNVLVRLEGADPSRTLLLEAHMDTVSVAGMTIEPFTPRQEGDLLYGRGSCDTKAGLAAMMYAMKRLRQEKMKPRTNVVLVGAVDEESGFSGASRLVQSGFRADGAVVSEPTELEVVVAHKGCLRWKIRTAGRAAHSSKVHLGVNAIAKMARSICALEETLGAAYATRQHPLLGPPTWNAGLISGGIQVNTVPDSCTIHIDRRLLPGETGETVYPEFQDVLARLEREDPDFHCEMEAPTLEDPPLETPQESPVVSAASEACRRVLGKSSVVGVPFGTDASKLSRAGIPSIVLGPGSIDQAHTAVEYVSIPQVVQAAAIYAEIMLRF